VAQLPLSSYSARSPRPALDLAQRPFQARPTLGRVGDVLLYLIHPADDPTRDGSDHRPDGQPRGRAQPLAAPTPVCHRCATSSNTASSTAAMTATDGHQRRHHGALTGSADFLGDLSELVRQ
jgi:hypothetical protein